MPPIPPEMMAAALARRGTANLPPAAVPPPPGVTPPLATRTPVTLPAGNPGPLPSNAPTPPAATPIRMGLGGRNLAEPSPPGVGATGVPYVPPSYTPPMSQAQPPSSSDDPAISPEMRKAMQSTQSAQAALDAEGQKYQDLSSKAAALKPPDYENYKPPLWKKIAAPFVGALAGRNAGPAVESMLYSPYNRAVQGYEQQKSALQQQLEAERGIGIPLAESRARVAQEGYTNTLNARKEAETEKRDTATEQYKSDLNEIRSNIASDKLDEAQKKLDETAEKNKNNFQMQNELLKVRQELADAAKERADKAAANGAGANGMTASEQRDFNAKTRRYQAEIDSLNRERAQMVGIPGDFATKRTAAIDKRLDELHGNIDKAEQDILDRRPQKGGAEATSGSGAKGFQVPKGAPNPTKPGQDLKMNNKIVAHSADGKSWGPPQ